MGSICERHSLLHLRQQDDLLDSEESRRTSSGRCGSIMQIASIMINFYDFLEEPHLSRSASVLGYVRDILEYRDMSPQSTDKLLTSSHRRKPWQPPTVGNYFDRKLRFSLMKSSSSFNLFSNNYLLLCFSFAVSLNLPSHFRVPTFCFASPSVANVCSVRYMRLPSHVRFV